MSEPTTSTPAGPDTLGFALAVHGERASLVLRDRAVFGWLGLERLELDIPGLSFPIDMAGGAGRFQRRRCRALRARLTLDDAGLAALLAARAPALAAAGFEELEARITGNAVTLVGHVRVGEHRAELVARLEGRGAGRALRLACPLVRLVGFVRRPAPVVAHDLLGALVGAGADGGAAAEAALVRRVGFEVEIDALDAVVWRLLPPAGWRLPDTAGAAAIAVEATRTGLALGYAPASEVAPEPAPRRDADLAAAEGRALAGDLDGAIAMCRAAQARGHGVASAATELLLALLAARESTAREAEEVARVLLARVPGHVGAHLALAGAALARDHADAAEHFARAADAADAAGDDETGVRAALMAARLAEDGDPRRATALWERVVERRPHLDEAAEALAGRYTADERWQDLARLARRRIAAWAVAGTRGGGVPDRAIEAREHVRLGELLLTHLADPERAREELEQAVRLADHDGRAWDALARAHAALGAADAAVAAWDRAAALAAGRRDAAAGARALAQAAAQREAQGDDADAEERYARAAALAPRDAGLQAALARVAARRGRIDDAARALARVAELAEGSDAAAPAQLALARLLAEAGRVAEARSALAAAGDDDAGEAQALAALLAEKEQDPAAAAEALARAAAAPAAPPAERAARHLRRGRLLAPLGRNADAALAFAAAWDAAPDRAAGQEATRALALMAREAGDAPAEVEWLERVIAGEPDAPDRGELLLRRASLALAAGEPGRARTLAEDALRAHADARAARLVLADAAGALGDPAARAALLEDAAEDTDGTATRAALLAAAARARLEAGDVEPALATARRASALAPDDADVRGALADAAWRARAWDDVIAAGDALIPRTTGAPRAEQARRLGVALAERGREREAVTALRAAVDEPGAPGDTLAQAYRRLADLLERTGDAVGAAQLLGRAAADARTGEAAPARAVAHTRAGDLLRKRAGDTAGAVAAYEAALRLDPEHLPALDALEAVHGEAGDLERVAAILGRKVAATARHPERQKALLARLAEIQATLGRPDAARAALERALELDPGFRPALRVLAPEALARGELDLARTLLTRLAGGTWGGPAGSAGRGGPSTDEAPDGDATPAERADALRLLAGVETRAGAVEPALEALRRALALAPEREDLWLALEEALAAAGRHAELADALGRRAALVTAADSRAALDERRAELLLRAREPRRALEVVRAALARAHAGPRLRELLAECARALDDPREEARALRALAESFAMAGDFAACAEHLARLVTILPAQSEAERAHLSELWLELADLRERRLGQWAEARAAVARAAQVAPPGAKKHTLLRTWAAYAAEAGADDEAIGALIALPEESRTISDWVGLARALARRGREREAIAAYEAAQGAGPLADDEALELFALYRRADELTTLARALERTAGHARPEAAVARLGEALALYTGPLADAEAAARVRAALAALGADAPPAPHAAAAPAPDAAAAGSAEALAEALAAHARDLAGRGLPLDETGRALLERVRDTARAERSFAPLAQALLAAAAVEPDGERAAEWLAEAAAVRRAHLDDAAGAADALARALAMVPGDEQIAQSLGDLLRELGDYARLLDVYELRLRRLQGAARAPVLAELGKVWAEAFGEPARAATCFAEALLHDPGRADLLLPLAEHHFREGELGPAADYFRRALAAAGDASPADRAAIRARLGELHLRRGDARAAVAELEPALAEAPGDGALVTLYEQALRQADEWDTLVARLCRRGDDETRPYGERLASLHEAAALLDGPLGRPQDAAPVYQAVLDLDPGDELARARLEALRIDPVELELAAGRAEEAAGREGAAIAHYENAWAEGAAVEALDALWRIACAREDHEAMAELLGRRLLVAGDDRRRRAELWLERARLYRDLLRREPEAYRCLKEAVACDPHNIEASSLLRTLAFARSEWPLAAELLYREIEAQPDAVERAALHVELAMIFEERLHDADSALRNYQTARDLDPTGPVPPRALARLYALARRFPDAARAEEAAAAGTAEPVTRAARLARAATLWEQAGDLGEAHRLRTAAAAVPGGGEAAATAAAKLARAAGDEDVHATRARLEARLEGAMPDEKLDILRRLLAAAVAAGDDGEIDRRAQEVLARDPRDLTAFLERKRVLSSRADWLTLAPLLRARADAETDAGERAALLFELGRLFAAKLRDQTRAAQAFEEALRAEPGHGPALDALADMAYRQHDWERARMLYRRLDENASSLGPDVVWFRRGELAEALGFEPEAEAAYRRAVDRNPSHLSAIEAIARLALVRGELTGAVAALEQLLDLLPLDDVERLTAARLQLGELCHKTGNANAARRYFELVLAEDPSSTAALTPMVELYASAAEWQKCAEALGRLAGLTTVPERRADLLFRMGEVLRVHLGDEARASDAYLKAVDLDEGHVPTLRRLVDYYFAEGDHDSLAEIVGELEARGALLVADTANETLARAAVSAALSDDARRAAELARHLGAAGAGTIAMALAEARGRTGDDARLANAARALCQGAGPSLEAVRAVLAARASKDPAAAALAEALT